MDTRYRVRPHLENPQSARSLRARRRLTQGYAPRPQYKITATTVVMLESIITIPRRHLFSAPPSISPPQF